MAKGHVTDQELESGLKSLGGLGNIAGSGAKRDSPFGVEFARKATPEAVPEALPVQPEPERRIDLKPVREVTPTPPATAPQSPEARRPPPVRAARDPAPRANEGFRPVEFLSDIPTRKSDCFTERVTLQMGPDMRDDLNLLAARLQRRKTDKSERITANTIMRVAIRILLDEVDLGTGEVANSETDLHRIVRQKLLGS
jgi:hypothetical protein